MSTFPGPLEEFPGVSVDRFDGENRQSSVFFLSHCHTDHMVGLAAGALPGPLYVSEISAVILRQKYPHLTNIHTVDIGVEKEISINGQAVMVTAIPAGHCPGSVMFLFESATCRILYTGDFRLRDKDVKNIAVFKRIRGQLDNLYVDSTFLSRSFENFPSRMDSMDTIVQLIEEWTAKSVNHTVWLKTPAHYGSEYLFREIHQRTRKPLHIDPQNMADYMYIPDMDGVFTLDEKQTQIHACWRPGCAIVQSGGNKVCKILPTAMYWRFWKEHRDFVEVSTKNPTEIRVCYSSHSSMRELRDFITFLQPQSVKLNVVQDSTRAEAYSIIREILSAEVITPPPAELVQEDTQVITLSRLKEKILHRKREEESDEAPMLIPKRKKL